MIIAKRTDVLEEDCVLNIDGVYQILVRNGL